MRLARPESQAWRMKSPAVIVLPRPTSSAMSNWDGQALMSRW